jgi:hypothetical protein
MLKLVLCVIASILLAGNTTGAQDKAVAKTDLAERRLKDVEIETESLSELITELSFTYDIPVGLEIARSGDPLRLYRIDFREGKLSELLTRFVAEHTEYAWKIEEGVLSIFPKDDYRDPLIGELLATKISSFSVSEKTNTFDFGKKLLSTPETKTVLHLYRTNKDLGFTGGFYIPQLGRKFAFDVSDMQVKSILDKVIKESPVARCWIISNNLSEQMIVLRVKAGAEAPSEDSPQ